MSSPTDRTVELPLVPEADTLPSPSDTGEPRVAPATVIEPDRQETAEAGAPELDAGQSAAPQQHPLVQDLLQHPTQWRIWPAVAVLRWLQRKIGSNAPRVVFRSHPSLGFASSEIKDIVLRPGHIDLILNAPGLASAGSPLPDADIANVIADTYNGGALSAWLDGPGDLFMHVLETVQMQSNPAFALLTGGRIRAHAIVADLVGRSATLSAEPGGDLKETVGGEPGGAVGLAGLFLGSISATGLAALVHAFTGLPVRIEEFVGAEVAVARPARVGGPLGLMLGLKCNLPSAGIEVHVDGGSSEDARQWARDPVRRRSLYRLALAYIGASSPAARIFLKLAGGNSPAAALDGGTAFGGLAVLGGSDQPVTLPLAAPP